MTSQEIMGAIALGLSSSISVTLSYINSRSYMSMPESVRRVLGISNEFMLFRQKTRWVGVVGIYVTVLGVTALLAPLSDTLRAVAIAAVVLCMLTQVTLFAWARSVARR